MTLELAPLQNTAITEAVSTATEAVTTAHHSLDTAHWQELLCVVVLPLLALLLGRAINRMIDRRSHSTMSIKIIDFTGPLVAPTLTIFLLMLASAGLHAVKLPIIVLPFIIKLAVAWFAIQLVILMSSRKSAGWVIALLIIPITLLHLFGLWDAVTDGLAEVSFSIGSVKLNLEQILRGIIAIFIMQWVASAIVRMTDSRLRTLQVRASNRTLVLKIVQFTLYGFIFLIGVQMLGIDLTALSVFGGALGVGLGFGLQKIASNFISGIILLFEKSVQVDDLIELSDGTTGFIRQTKARYTLIETVDGRDVMIPNEEFISQRVNNWTFSNKKARVEVKLGVSYDADIDLARQLMIDAAKAHPKTLPNTEPLCFLNQFGESSIELLLYFWVADVTDGRLEPRSDVMRTIWHSFKEHHITIPYPQREVRIINAKTEDNA